MRLLALISTRGYIQHSYCKVLSLRNNGISACLVGGSSDLKTEERATRGEFPLVFITPEKVRWNLPIWL